MQKPYEVPPLVKISYMIDKRKLKGLYEVKKMDLGSEKGQEGWAAVYSRVDIVSYKQVGVSTGAGATIGTQ